MISPSRLWKHFASTKVVGHKKFWVQKNIGSKQYGSNKIFDPENDEAEKNVGFQSLEKFGEENVGYKNISSPK